MLAAEAAALAAEAAALAGAATLGCALEGNLEWVAEVQVQAEAEVEGSPADTQQAAAAVPAEQRQRQRVMFLSGMYASEVMEMLGLYRESGEGGTVKRERARGPEARGGPSCKQGAARARLSDTPRRRPARSPLPPPAGLPPAVFAAAVPNNWGRPLAELVDDVCADHAAMQARAEGRKRGGRRARAGRGGAGAMEGGGALWAGCCCCCCCWWWWWCCVGPGRGGGAAAHTPCELTPRASRPLQAAAQERRRQQQQGE